MAYLVLPVALAAAFNSALNQLYRPGQLPMQVALSEFMSLGYFETHLRNMRQHYGAKRELLRRLLDTGLRQLGLRVSTEESGLHLLIELPIDADDRAIARRAEQFDIQLFSLSDYYLTLPNRKGLLVGYAYVEPEKILKFGAALVSLLTQELGQQAAY